LPTRRSSDLLGAPPDAQEGPPQPPRAADDGGQAQAPPVLPREDGLRGVQGPDRPPGPAPLRQAGTTTRRTPAAGAGEAGAFMRSGGARGGSPQRERPAATAPGTGRGAAAEREQKERE